LKYTILAKKSSPLVVGNKKWDHGHQKRKNWVTIVFPEGCVASYPHGGTLLTKYIKPDTIQCGYGLAR
jgi:hypothetical protein